MNPRLVPTSVTPPDTASDDPRVGHLLGGAADDRARAVIVGFPTDVGVQRNGGRPGAAQAPDEIRRFLYRLTPDARLPDHVAVLTRTRDLGNIATSGDLERDQEALAEVVAEALASGAFVIVLGGGHETGYAHFLGHARREQPVEILNVDAHTDVRPLKAGLGHSGSPFRQALLHPSRLARRYHVVGLEASTVAAAHAAFVAEHGGRVLWRDAIDDDSWSSFLHGISGPALASFDMDAVAAGHAPGVSAPAVAGLDVVRWLHAAHHVGATPAFRSFDLSEVNPAQDVDGRTCRLAALTIWTVLRGLAARPA